MKSRAGRNATTVNACGQLQFGDDWNAVLFRNCQLEPTELDTLLAGEPIPDRVWDDIVPCISHLTALAKLKRRKEAGVQ